MRIIKEELFLEFAKLVSKRSTCDRLQVGAVIVTSDFKYVVGYGYNGNYSKGPNNCDSNAQGNCGCIHAEENALLKCIEKDKDCYLFITNSPCIKCTKLIINSGNIKKVYYEEDYRDIEPLKILVNSGIEVIRYVSENKRFESISWQKSIGN